MSVKNLNLLSPRLGGPSPRTLPTPSERAERMQQPVQRRRRKREPVNMDHYWLRQTCRWRALIRSMEHCWNISIPTSCPPGNACSTRSSQLVLESRCSSAVQAFRHWVNRYLTTKYPPVQLLETAFQTGFNLVHLLEILSGGVCTHTSNHKNQCWHCSTIGGGGR